MSRTSSEPMKDFANSKVEHEIVRAGAGAGKTYTLTHKVMDVADEHLAKSQRLPRVIVTTFTRKATQELRERLMLLALEKRPHLIDFVNSRSHLVVSTIHGVMDLYLKRYGANLCIDPGYRIVGGSESSKLARQVLRKVIHSDENSSDLLEIFPFNTLATHVRRINAVLHERPKARPYSMGDFERLFASYAERAALELEESARNIGASTDRPDWTKEAEAHREIARLIRSGSWVDVRNSVVEAISNMKSARKHATVPEELVEETKELRKRVKKLVDSVFDPADWTAFADLYARLDAVGRKFHEEFHAAKIEQGVLEISDLEHLAMDCIRRYPQTAEAFWQEWDHWMIDEYQDTSPFQVALIRALAGESPQFVVGDPQQSIYLFRGARSEVFGERENEILTSGGSKRLLTVNRRSEPELLLFLNDFFARMNPPFERMAPFIEEGEVMDPSKIVATFYAAPEDGEAVRASADGDGESDSDETSEISNEEAASHREMKALVAHVQMILEAGARPEEICVLARTNKTLNEVAIWLNRHGLPTHVHAASGFFDRREIRDALAILKFMANPHDNLNLVELLRSPWFRVPDEAIVEVTIKRPESYWEAMVSLRSMADEWAAVRELQNLLRVAAEKGFVEAFESSLMSAGFVDLSHRHDVSGRRESNVWKLLSRLQSEESKPGFNILSFIAGSISDLKSDEASSEGDAVAAVEPDRINLMTVHASKGLEFAHVILPRMEQRPNLTHDEAFTFDERGDGLWAVRVPSEEEGKTKSSLAEKVWLEEFRKQELLEHARVLYVALTRASKSVFMSWTGLPKRHSWASMIGFDLTPGNHSGESYTYRVESDEPSPRLLDTESSNKIEVPSLWREPREPETLMDLPQDGETKKALSVSQILDRKPGAHAVSPTGEREVIRMMRVASEGTAVHRLMELLKHRSRVNIERLVAKWFPEREDQVLKAIEFVKSSESPRLLEVIENGEVEWGFAFVEETALIEGQIDLWGRDDSGQAWLVDYKTGNPEYKDKAFDQMALYALALRKSGLLDPNETLKIAAVYPFSEQIYISEEPPVARVRVMLGL